MAEFRISQSQVQVIINLVNDLASDLVYYRDSARWDKLECFDLLTSITKVGLVPADEETPQLIQLSIDKLNQIAPILSNLPAHIDTDLGGDKCQDLIDAIEDLNKIPGNITSIVSNQFNANFISLEQDFISLENNIVDAIIGIDLPEFDDSNILSGISSTRTELREVREDAKDILNWINGFSFPPSKDDEILVRISDARTELKEVREDAKDILNWINNYSFDPVCDKIDELKDLIGGLDIDIDFSSISVQLDFIESQLNNLDVDVDLSSINADLSTIKSQLNNLDVDVDLSSITADLSTINANLTSVNSNIVSEINNLGNQVENIEFPTDVDLSPVLNQLTILQDFTSSASTSIFNDLDSLKVNVENLQTTINDLAPLINQINDEVQNDDVDLSAIEECLGEVKGILGANFSGEISRQCGDGDPVVYPYGGDGLAGIVSQVQAISLSLSDTSAEVCEVGDNSPAVVLPGDKYHNHKLVRQLCLKFIPADEQENYSSKTPSWHMSVPEPVEGLDWDDISPLAYSRGNIGARIWFNVRNFWCGGFFSSEGEANQFLTYLATLSSLGLKYPTPKITKPSGINRRNPSVIDVVPWTATIVNFDDEGNITTVERIKRKE